MEEKGSSIKNLDFSGMTDEQIIEKYEKVLMEQDVKKYDKDVKNLALNTNALHYQVKQFKNKIKEIKIILEQKKKETGFLKDVTNLINIV